MKRFFIVLSLSLLACSDDESSGRPTQTVKDQAGRTCTIGEALSATCDRPPTPSVACKPTATACYDVGTTGSAAGPGAICASCCEGNTSSSVAADCSNIVCTADTDCPTPYGRCVKGECRN